MNPTPTKRQMATVVRLAEAAGHIAARATTPTPMVVVEHANPLDDNSEIVHRYAPAMGGVCGFAWINVKPGTSRFARWLVATDHARRDSYYGGVTIWVHDYGQSMERKEAYARAYAEVLRSAGFEASAHSRMD